VSQLGLVGLRLGLELVMSLVLGFMVRVSVGNIGGGYKPGLPAQ